MDEYVFICAKCDSLDCNGICDPMNWTNQEVIDEFIAQMNDGEDGILTVLQLQEWFW
jgi:hypothetical protein